MRLYLLIREIAMTPESSHRPPERFWAGQEVPKTAVYGQFHDRTLNYAGAGNDRPLKKGDPFPRALKDHHYREL